MPTHLVAHLYFFCNRTKHIKKNPKEPASSRTKDSENGQTNHERKRTTKA